MSEQSNGPETEARQAAENGAGRTLKEARIAANIDVNKICTDLRISPQALESLERGDYNSLPGDPYIRALLGSLGRYLGIDPLSLVQSYNKEIGAVHASPSIAPYKDRAHTYTTAHKQIFIGIFLALFVVLFFLIGKLNKGESDAAKNAPAPGAAAADSMAMQQDTALERRSLAPDSASAKGSPDSGEMRGYAGSVKAPSSKLDTSKAGKNGRAAPGMRPADAAGQSAVKGANAANAGAAQTAPSTGASAASGAGPGAGTPAANGTTATAAASPELNSAIVKPLIDSVGVKVMRSGKEDFATLLRLGKQMQVSHTDTIVIFISKRRSVEVDVGGKTVIPDRKRFKIYGNTLKTF